MTGWTSFHACDTHQISVKRLMEPAASDAELNGCQDETKQKSTVVHFEVCSLDVVLGGKKNVMRMTASIVHKK